MPGEQPAAAQGRAERGFGDFGLAHQEEVGVISRQGIVERRLDWIVGSRWAHDPRRDNDSEVGLVLLIRRAAEQRAEHGHIAQPRELLQIGLAHGLQQAADHEALAVAQLHHRAGAPDDEGGHLKVADRYRMVRVDLAHFRLNHHVDHAVLEHRRRERKSDTVLLVIDRDAVEGARNRNRIFAAREEARGISRQGHQIGLGQGADETLLLKRIEEEVDRRSPAEHAAEHEAEWRGAGEHAGRDFAGGRDIWRGRRRERKSTRRLARTDDRLGFVIEHVPLHAQLAAGLTGGFDEARLEHHLLRLRDHHRIDDVGRELAGDCHGAVQRCSIRRGAGQHHASVDR